jgi:NADH:ubiquinone oxidoreductase subunit K
MIALGGLIGLMGLICITLRRTFLGVLIGVELLMLGASLTFVLAGVLSGRAVDGNLFGLFITLSGVSQLVTGFVLCVRLFYLKRRPLMTELKNLRH